MIGSFFRIMVCVSVLLIGASVCVRASEGPRSEREQSLDTLACGLTVVTECMTDEPSVDTDEETSVWIVVHRGASDQRDDECGAAMIASYALRLHLASIGIDVEALLDPQGPGLFNPGISTQHSVVMMTVEDADDLAASMRVARIMLGGFDPSGEVLEQARALVLEESEMRRQTSYDSHARADWMRSLLSDGPLSREALALTEQIESIDLDRVRAYVDRCWRASNASVLAIGSISNSDVLSASNDAFEGLGFKEPGIRNAEVLDLDDVRGNIVTRASERFEQDLYALVWFNPDHEDQRIDVAKRAALAVAGEASRARVFARVRDEMGTESVNSTAQMGVIAQGVSYAQMILKADPGQPLVALDALTIEAEVLRKRGVSPAEFERAREIVRRQFAAQLDRFIDGSPAQRASLRAYFIAHGDAERSPEDWVKALLVSVETMTLEDVNAMIETMLSAHDPAVVVLQSGSDVIDEDTIRGVLRSAPERFAASPDRDGVLESEASVLDLSPAGGEVREIRMHRDSGVVSARFENGVWAHHHRLGADGRVQISVHVGFPEPSPGVWEGPGSRVFSAMQRAQLVRRLDDEVQVFVDVHGIEHDIEIDALGLSVHVSGDRASIDALMEFVYALLTDVRFDGSESEDRELVGSMELGIAQAFGRVGDQTLRVGDDVSASMWWRERMMSSTIEIGVSGDVDAEHVLTRAARMFGALPNTARGDADDSEMNEAPEAVMNMSRSSEISCAPNESGVVTGFTACDVGSVSETRALVIAGLVLGERLEVSGIGVSSYASSLVLPAVGDRALLLARVWCDEDEMDLTAARIWELIDQSADLSMHDDEIERARARLLDVLDAMIDTPEFWSSRLSRLGSMHQEVGDVWSIRDSYASMSALDINTVYRRWHREGQRFEVRLIPENTE